jgi:hypothetical protein
MELVSLSLVNKGQGIFSRFVAPMKNASDIKKISGRLRAVIMAIAVGNNSRIKHLDIDGTNH